MRSVNSARERLKPVVLMLATLFAITSRFCSWALIPVAAIANALISTASAPVPNPPRRAIHDPDSRSDRHARNLLKSSDRLVADRKNGLERTLRRHHRLDALHRRRCSFHALNSDSLAGLQGVHYGTDRLGERLFEAGPFGRRRGGMRAPNASAEAR